MRDERETPPPSRAKLNAPSAETPGWIRLPLRRYPSGNLAGVPEGYAGNPAGMPAYLRRQ